MFADPESNYSIAKHRARQIFLEDIKSRQISWIRPHFVFNGKDWPKFIYSDAIQPLVINDDSPRDFIHIKDVALGINKVLENNLMGEIDIGSGILKRPSDLCKALGLKFSTAGTRHEPTQPNTKAGAANPLVLFRTGWQPRYTEKIFGKSQAGQSLDVS
jgi:nucleoside-diphosphate-sugar epimerase